ncbi:Uncharacterised protein [Kluyvera cryocrescens]|uniref:Uncharacterized protein n=1 Tax=Kluyvera cryocrescens TaxID=580 RepID=A0A485D2Z8_KLUCR|nr:Uncharacterised protein [Kluyvera cryocrescens]
MAENLSLRTGNYRFLVFQRMMVSVVVIAALLITSRTQAFYWLWTASHAGADRGLHRAHVPSQHPALVALGRTQQRGVLLRNTAST